MRHFMRKDEFVIFCFVFASFMAIALWLHVPPPAPNEGLFGYEYGNIAEAIVDGAGYANPFGLATGPTSWMPPFYPFFLALLFWAFGVKTAASLYVLLTVKYLALAAVPVLLLRICRAAVSGLKSLLIIPIYLFLVFSSFGSFFTTNDDVWVYTLFVSLLVLKYCGYAINGGPNTMGLDWGLLGGLIFLTNPVLGMVYVFLTLLPLVNVPLKKRISMLLLAGLVFSPWLSRNHAVFDHFIFVKSNLFFETYQNNIADDDGLLDGQNLSHCHPYFNAQVCREYASMGEVAFINKYRHAFLAGLRKSPLDFLGKTANRLVHIFWVYPEFTPRPEAAEALDHVKFYLKAGTYWFPFAIVMVLLLKRKTRSDKTVQIGSMIYFTYLVPFVFVGYYNRYRIPLLPVFALFYFHFSVYVLDTLVHGRRRVAAYLRLPRKS